MAEVGAEVPYGFDAAASTDVIAETTDAAGARTLEILEHRRRTGHPRRRGWLVRRMLVLADLVGLVAAFAIVELVVGTGGGAENAAPGIDELLLLLATLPGWIVIAKLYGLYDQDEERTHHPTTDDFGGVFHLVTVGCWLFFALTWVTGIAHPGFTK